MRVKEVYRNWKSAKNYNLDLNELLQRIPDPKSDIESQMIFVGEILDWIRRPSLFSKASSLLTPSSQGRRVKLFLHKLQSEPDLHQKFSNLLSYIFLNTDAISLLTKIGLVDHDSFLLDLTKRIQRKILPIAPEYENLSHLISKNFERESDYQFLTKLDERQITFLFSLFESQKKELIAHFKEQIHESILLLTAQISGLALHSDLRKRMRSHSLENNPFLQLEYLSRDLFLIHKNSNLDSKLKSEQNSKSKTKLKIQSDSKSKLKLKKINEAKLKQLTNEIDFQIKESFRYLKDVHKNLERYGVDTNIVYKIEKLEDQLERVLILLRLNQKNSSPKNQVYSFVLHLIKENVRQKSVLSLTKDNLTLLSRKITERSAETGEHYIAKDSKEFYYLLKKALGGGAVTSLTVLFKFITAHLHLTGIATGLVASFNYCISFLGIQALGFTLATKQPAMTAPTLAEKMQGIEEDENLKILCDEIILLIRSQFIAVFGNIISVIPFVILFHFIYLYSFQSSIVTDDKALKTISSFSILGLTPFYAAFTGVLLFISSLISGWFDNWFVYNRLDYALGTNPKLRYLLGKEGAIQFGGFWKRNIAGISGNISLGFMLGMIPVLGDFFLLPLDVRHVTLSTGALTLSAIQLGLESLTRFPFWLAILGVLSMAILNLGVSFALAMLIAIRAKRITAPNRGKIYLALLTRWRKNPLVFFFPPRERG